MKHLRDNIIDEVLEEYYLRAPMDEIFSTFKENLLCRLSEYTNEDLHELAVKFGLMKEEDEIID